MRCAEASAQPSPNLRLWGHACRKNTSNLHLLVAHRSVLTHCVTEGRITLQRTRRSHLVATLGSRASRLNMMYATR